MNQKLENNQPCVVIENAPGTSDIDVNTAQDLKSPDVDDSNITPEGKTINNEIIGMIDKVLDLLNDYEITIEDKKQILKGAIERLN
jgi:hypothetical protein